MWLAIGETDGRGVWVSHEVCWSWSQTVEYIEFLGVLFQAGRNSGKQRRSDLEVLSIALGSASRI